MKYRTCSQCKKTLPETPEYFDVSKYGSTGFRAMCQNCRRARNIINQQAFYARKRAGMNLPAKTRTRLEPTVFDAVKVRAAPSTPVEKYEDGVRKITFPDGWRPFRDGKKPSADPFAGYVASTERGL